jgi:hypothetical protein
VHLSHGQASLAIRPFGNVNGRVLAGFPAAERLQAVQTGGRTMDYAEFLTISSRNIQYNIFYHIFFT